MVASVGDHIKTTRSSSAFDFIDLFINIQQLFVWDHRKSKMRQPLPELIPVSIHPHSFVALLLQQPQHNQFGKQRLVVVKEYLFATIGIKIMRAQPGFENEMVFWKR